VTNTFIILFHHPVKDLFFIIFDRN